MSTYDDRDFELSRLIDGDLPADAAARLRAALERDAGLRGDHAELARVDELVRAAADPLPANVNWTAFRQQLSARIAADTVVPSRRRTIIRVFAPLAAAAAVALFVLFRPSELVPDDPLVQVAYAPTESIALPTDANGVSAIESGVAASYEPPESFPTSEPAAGPRRAFILVTVGGRTTVTTNSPNAGAGAMF